MRKLSIAASLAAAALVMGAVPAAAVAISPVGVGSAVAAAATEYTNPLPLTLPSSQAAEQCADPDVIRSADPADPAWYLFCTRDALDADETNPDGSLRFYSIPTYRSTDLVNWAFVAEALPQKPAWIGNGDMWAPDVVYLNGSYHLYYTATETTGPGGGSAIGVATADTPAGPWVDAGAPVVEPMAPPGSAVPTDRRWVFDPEVLTANGQNYLYFGSYFGGLSVRELSADGLSTDPASQVEIAISNRYEGTNVVEHDGYYYLLGSATNCCAGPLTGYGVFAGRSTSPTGPFVDRTGTSLLAGRVGGTPVLHQNGNRWIGTGHNSMITDLAGTSWIYYHAVDRNDPYLVEGGTYTKRPVLMDRVDWVDGWPVVRGGAGPSDTPQAAPVTQPGQVAGAAPARTETPEPGAAIAALSDEFDGETLSPQWSWIREPGASTYGVENGAFRFDTQVADLSPDPGAAGLLTEPAPDGDYVVETRLSVSVPAEGCCQNFVQGGIVVYTDDGNFIKHAVSSIWETRQTEFAKRQSPVPPNYPVYGNSVGGPVGENTYLRIVRQHSETENLYTGYTSLDGVTWDESGTWTTPLGSPTRLGLVSMAGGGFVSTFDYLRVSALAVEPTTPPVEPTTPPVDPSTPAVPPVTTPSVSPSPGSAVDTSGDRTSRSPAKARGSLSQSGVDNTGLVIAAGVAGALLVVGLILLIVRRQGARRAQRRHN
jgi:arabinan endo-1,5-alpha-L-arabinosidase